MRFQLADDVFEPEITNATKIVSRSTGRELRHLTIRFRTRGVGERKRLDISPTGTRLVSIDDVPPGHWRKVGTSSSMNDGRSSNWVHTWELEEMENIIPEALIVNDLRVKPERYAEHWRGDRLEVHALLAVSAEEHKVLKKIVASDEPTSVVRVGVSDEPRSMEVHEGPWSERDGSFHWLVRLEDSAREAEERPNAGWLQMGRTYHSVPYLLASFEEMANVLIAKGLITDEDYKGVKERAFATRGERAVELMKVDDVEKFWDEEAFSR
jgi:hypothetical protein